MSKFLDAAYPGTAGAFISALQHEQAQGFAWYCGGNYVLNIWGLRHLQARREAARLRSAGVVEERSAHIRSWLEQSPRAVSGLVGAIEAAGYQGMAIYVSTVGGRSGAADGLDAANIVARRGARPGYKIVWDLEAGIYQGNPAAAAAYGNAWCDAVRSRGFSPVVYSTPAGCRGCGTHADAVWAAVPGHSNPANVFTDPFMAGRIAVQYGGGSWGGVTYDVNITQFSLSGFAPSLGLAGGGTMLSFRPGDGDRHDAVFVIHDGANFVHAWGNNISGDRTAILGEEPWGVPAGKTLVAGTAFCAWDGSGSWFMWGAQATDGTWWYGWGDVAKSNQSGWQRWYNFLSDVPAAGQPGTGPGPAYDDSEIRADLERHEADLQAIKNAIK